MATISAVAFVPYPLGTAPSQRFRLEQWQRHVEARGICLQFRVFAPPALVRELYRPGQPLRKGLSLAKAIVAQYRQIPPPGLFDVAIVHRSMSLAGPALLERRLARAVPFVYDFDDAIHLLNTSEANRSFGWLKFPEKTGEICRMARAVTVGNEYLGSFARTFNQDVTIVPSSIDTSVYRPGAAREPRASPIVGWMGSSTSQALIESYAAVLARMTEAGFRFRIVSDRRPTNFQFPVEWRPWSAETEVAELRDFDIGIMPLPDTEWAKGKCAMKILQYMGVGVPSVGSALGGNLEVIENGANGFLATTDDDWIEKITRLARNPVLARTLGAAGRETVVSRYSSEVCANQFADVLHRVVGT